MRERAAAKAQEAVARKDVPPRSGNPMDSWLAG